MVCYKKGFIHKINPKSSFIRIFVA